MVEIRTIHAKNAIFQHTKGFLTIKSFQINTIVDSNNLGFIIFLPNISGHNPHIAIKSSPDITGGTLGIQVKIIEGAAVVKFQNKV